VQHLRTLIRNARKEQAENKPPKAYREIFQILKQLQADAARQERSRRGEADEQDDDEREAVTPVAVLRVGLVSISDRASGGVYQDQGIPPCRNGWHATGAFRRDPPDRRRTCADRRP
jgi:hypothetical protein